MADGYTNKLRQTILTNNGRNTFLQVSNGDGTLVYTRASLTSQSMNDSNGNPLNNEIIANLSSLSDDLKDGKLQITPVTGNQFELIANFDNKNQGQDINFSAIGWYARIDTKNDSGQTVEGSEVLIAVSPTTNATEALAAGSPDGLSTQVISAALDMNISNAANISMTVNDIGYVTRAELDAWQTKIEETISAGYIELPMRNSGGQQLFDHNGEAISFKKSLIDIDRSLSQEGKPADAGATGKKLNEINSSLEQLNQNIYNNFDTKQNAQDLKNGILANADANNQQDGQINGLITRTNEQDGQINGLVTRANDIESGVINNTRTINILSHDSNNLATHDSATVTAQTEYIKTDSTLSNYGAVANAGKVGEAIKQTFLILNASLNQLVAGYNSLQSNQVIVDLNNKVLALKDQIDAAIQALQKNVEISSAESQANNLDALHDPGRYYLGTVTAATLGTDDGYSDAVLEVDKLGNTNKVMQYIYSAGNTSNRSERRIGTKNGNSYSWSSWNVEY